MAIRNRVAFVPVLLACLLGTGEALLAQDYPNRIIRVVVGPGPDLVARLFGPKITELLGQAVVVEPRPGAGECRNGRVEQARPRPADRCRQEFRPRRRVDAGEAAQGSSGVRLLGRGGPGAHCGQGYACRAMAKLECSYSDSPAASRACWRSS